jgi:hypothetical protein
MKSTCDLDLLNLDILSLVQCPLLDAVGADDNSKEDDHKEECDTLYSWNKSLENQSHKNDDNAKEQNQTDWCTSGKIIPE